MRFTQHFDQFFVWVDHLTIISRNYLEFEIIILFIPFLCQQIISRKGKSEESKIIKKEIQPVWSNVLYIIKR